MYVIQSSSVLRPISYYYYCRVHIVNFSTRGSLDNNNNNNIHVNGTLYNNSTIRGVYVYNNNNNNMV